MGVTCTLYPSGFDGKGRNPTTVNWQGETGSVVEVTGMVQAGKNRSNRDMSKGAGGVNAVGSSRSALDLGVKALSNQRFDHSLLLEQGQLICKTECLAARGCYRMIRGVPLAICVVASRSFWNDIGGLGCFATSGWICKCFAFWYSRTARTFGLILDLVDPPCLVEFSGEREENPTPIGEAFKRT